MKSRLATWNEKALSTILLLLLHIFEGLVIEELTLELYLLPNITIVFHTLYCISSQGGSSYYNRPCLVAKYFYIYKSWYRWKTTELKNKSNNAFNMIHKNFGGYLKRLSTWSAPRGLDSKHYMHGPLNTTENLTLSSTRYEPTPIIWERGQEDGSKIWNPLLACPKLVFDP